jgi:hypothetical protein
MWGELGDHAGPVWDQGTQQVGEFCDATTENLAEMFEGY